MHVLTRCYPSQTHSLSIVATHCTRNTPISFTPSPEEPTIERHTKVLVLLPLPKIAKLFPCEVPNIICQSLGSEGGSLPTPLETKLACLHSLLKIKATDQLMSNIAFFLILRSPASSENCSIFASNVCSELILVKTKSTSIHCECHGYTKFDRHDFDWQPLLQ
jgi:hypothetical protein